MIKLIFIRHTATEWNDQRRYLGATDVNLNQKGLKQAKLISNYLRNKKISAIYSSDLKRAYQTATIIAKYHSFYHVRDSENTEKTQKKHISNGVKIKRDKRLNEFDFGKWEGKTFYQIQKEYPDLAKKYLLNPLDAKIPNGETFPKFKNRVDKALKQILAKEKGTIVVVSHAGVNRAIICSLFNLSLSYFLQIKQDVGAINIIEIYPVRDSGGNEEAQTPLEVNELKKKHKENRPLTGQDKHISNGVNIISLINFTPW